MTDEKDNDKEQELPSNVVRFNRMSDATYERERQKLLDTVGPVDGTNKQAGAKRDQLWASFFDSTGWTQKELAKREGTSQQHVARRLAFGRFLNFTPTGVNAGKLPNDLTERKFRDYWDAADKMGGNEPQRFIAVMKAMAADSEGGKLKLSTTGIPKKIAEKFGNGKWHDEQKVVAHFADEHPPELILKALSSRANRTGSGVRVERERHGRGYRVRVFGAEARDMIPMLEIVTKLRPLIDGLKAEGAKKNATLLSIGAVARFAALLERQIVEWEQGPPHKRQSKEDDDE